MVSLSSRFLCVLIGLTVVIYQVQGDDFKEEIFIKPIPPTHLYVNFQFVTLVDSDSSFEHSHLAPRSLGEIISRFQVEELHLTLTEGQWRHHQWGYPVLDAAPGAELYAWFSPDVVDIDAQWKKLSATLSGLFCASLNFIDKTNTVSPQMTLWPTGAIKNSENVTSQLRYASLPREIVCTENLTPWKKLLPCESSRGFAALLNSRMIHNTNYHSVGVHVRNKCASKDCTETQLEIKQTVALVYDYKIINSVDWSLRKLFGQGLPGACPLASTSRIYVDLTSNSTQQFNLVPSPDSIITSTRGGVDSVLGTYDILPNGTMINIAARQVNYKPVVVTIPPPLHFNHYVLGYGREFGGIVTEIINNCWTPIQVVVLENAPWWLPIQLSSLRINGEAESDLVLSQYYSPGRSRQKPYHLELLLKLPPRSKTTITIDFEFVFLKWQEYPPDANHGFYIGSALISAKLPTARNYTSLPITGSTFDSVINASQLWYPFVFRSNGAMVSLPTPDFSMPYNVICLTCTVVALAFGPLHNICTKELVLKPMGTPVSLVQKVLSLFKRKKD
ncbi:gpi16 subunit, GPI transamidase component domain-containing protein [Phthorimaea operculella]|nr:gpi16 subunit, GPI transamidase component domain-containing protein [Phthorimaea operculella]